MSKKITVIEANDYTGKEIIDQCHGYDLSEEDIPDEVAEWAECRYSEDAYLKEDELPTIEWYSKKDYTEEQIKEMIDKRNLGKEEQFTCNNGEVIKYRANQEDLEYEETEEDNYWIVYDDNETEFV